MRRKSYWRQLIALGLVIATVFLSACKNNSGENEANNGVDTEQSQYVLSFVAADKTNWDLEVGIGDFMYTIMIGLNQDNTLKLSATCVGRNESQDGGGMGGFGGPPMEEEAAPEDGKDDFGPPMGEEAAPEDDKDDFGPPMGEEVAPETDTEAPPLSEKEMAAKGFEIDGTWTYETGWGYTLTFDDGNNTTITASYEKASGRQYFYYDLAPIIDGQQEDAVQVQFQAEDREFRKEMASDYVIAEERNAKYIFKNSGKAVGGNPTMITIYCNENGTLNMLNMRGSESSYSKGTWMEDEATNTIIITLGDVEYTTDYSDIPGKEGYRLKYQASGPFGGNGDIICYATKVEGFNTNDYVASDFEGETIHTLTSLEGDYTIELTEKGFLNVYSEGSLFESSAYSYDTATDIYELDLSGEIYTTTKEDEVYSVTATLTKEAENPFTPEVSETRIFTFQ